MNVEGDADEDDKQMARLRRMNARELTVTNTLSLHSSDIFLLVTVRESQTAISHYKHFRETLRARE